MIGFFKEKMEYKVGDDLGFFFLLHDIAATDEGTLRTFI